MLNPVQAVRIRMYVESFDGTTVLELHSFFFFKIMIPSSFCFVLFIYRWLHMFRQENTPIFQNTAVYKQNSYLPFS